MCPTSNPSRRRHTGFTLTETLIAMTITAVALAAATGFYVETTKGHYLVNQRINQAMDIRKLSQEMIYNASRANQFVLYRSAVPADRDHPDNDPKTIDTTNPSSLLHPAGDFIVFVFFEFPKPANQNYHRIQKLVGYYLDTPAGGIGRIRKMTIDLSRNLGTGAPTPNDMVAAYDPSATTARKTVIEQVMTNHWTNPAHARFDNFILTARGLLKSELTADVGDPGRLFYIRDAKSIMVAGQLFGAVANDKRETTTDTFTFTVTPRS